MFMYGLLAAQKFDRLDLPPIRPPLELFVLATVEPGGAIIGTLGGQPIHDIVADPAGARYRFIGVTARRADGTYDVSGLAEDEWIVDAGLIYAADCPEARRRSRIVGRSERHR